MKWLWLCNAMVILAAPSQPQGAAMPIEVPTSPLFDVTAPQTITRSLRIGVAAPDHTLAMTIAVSTNFATPGSTVDLTVQLPQRGEVTVAVVDKAIFDLKPEEISSMRSLTSVDASVAFQSCLLYTSPSPRDKRQSRMPSSA